MFQTPLKLALVLTLTFLASALMPRIHGNPKLLYSVLVTAGICLAWTFYLAQNVSQNSRTLKLEYLAKGNHWIQLIVQAIIIVYICLHWTNFIHQLPLIVGQIVLAYIIELLAQFSTRDNVKLGYGPFPIIISINLFIWFKDDFFYLQYAMVTMGILFKYLFTWNRWGRKRHIFNPSAISLFVFSIFLLVTDSTRSLTHAIDVSTKIYPDTAYLLLFGTGLIVQYYFRVTLMTLFGVGGLAFFGIMYLKISGLYWFVDANIPPAVFLGLHLLVTDPKTAPRSSLGRSLFGFVYGCSIFVLYIILDNYGAPTLYDKILFMPVLNLTAPLFDSLSQRLTKRMENFFTQTLPGSLLAHNLTHMAVWCLLFATLLSLGFFTPHHPGRTFAFWQDACDRKIEKGCHTLLRLQLSECKNGRGPVCNMLGASIEKYPQESANIEALKPSIYYFDMACKNNGKAGCLNFLNNFVFKNQGTDLFASVLPALKITANQCKEGDPNSCYVAGFTFVNGVGVEASKPRAAFLFNQGCEAGSIKACGIGGHMFLTGDGVPRKPDTAREMFTKACDGNDGASCRFLGMMYVNGDGVEKNLQVAREKMTKGCQLGSAEACGWLKKAR